MCQPAHLLHEINIKDKSLKSTSDVLIMTFSAARLSPYFMPITIQVLHHHNNSFTRKSKLILSVSCTWVKSMFSQDLVYENHTYFENSVSINLEQTWHFGG